MVTNTFDDLARTIAREIKNRHRTTGWRDVSDWVPNRTSGRLLVIRNHLEMIVVLDELTVSVSGSFGTTRFPSGLRPSYRTLSSWYRSDGLEGSGVMNLSGGGYFNIYNTVAGQAMSARLVADFLPTAGWPNPLPGDPA